MCCDQAGWLLDPAFVWPGPPRGCWELGIRTLVMTSGWWHLPALYTGTPPSQRGGLSFPLCMAPACLAHRHPSLPAWRPQFPPLYSKEVAGDALEFPCRSEVEKEDRSHRQPGFLTSPGGVGCILFQMRLGVARTSLETPGSSKVTLGKAPAAGTGVWKPCHP